MKEQTSQVTWRTYVKFAFYRAVNYFLVPAMMVAFVLAEILSLGFVWLLSRYDIEKKSIELGTREGYFEHLNQFWLALLIALLIEFVLNVVKNYLMIYAIRQNDTKIHNDMLFRILRSHLSYYDLLPSGILQNRLSSDLTAIDQELPYIFINIIQNTLTVLFSLSAVVQMNIMSLAGIAFNVVVGTCFFLYSKPVIVNCKQL